MLTFFDHFTLSISYAYSRYEHSQRQLYWRKEHVSANILAQTYSYGIAYLKSQLDAPIYWRSYNSEEHFYPASPIHPAIA
jgi:hypothetical protein